MSIIIKKRPILTDADGTFKWNSVSNPVNYELQREDFNSAGGDIISTQDSGAGLTRINTSSPASDLGAVGDIVYFSSSDGLYDSLATVEAVGGANLTISTPFNGAIVLGTAYLNNITQRTNHRIDVFFFNPDDDTKYFTEGTEYATQQNGFLRIDVSGIMRSFLEATYFDQSPQDTLSTDFYIEIIEHFSGTSEAPINDSANPVGVVLASKQLLDEFGSIMKEFTAVVTQDGGGFTVNNEGRLLTRFKEPTMWVGWPNFIFGLSNGDNSYSGAQNDILEQALNINRAETTGKNTINLSGAAANEINRIRLTDSRLSGGEEFRRVTAIVAISLLAVQTATATASLLAAGATVGEVPPNVSLLTVGNLV